MATTRPPTLLVQALQSGQTLHAAPNRPRPHLGWRAESGVVTLAGAGHGADLEVDPELILGEPASRCGGQLRLDHRGELLSVSQARWTPVP
jgi:hypothetical protein